MDSTAITPTVADRFRSRSSAGGGSGLGSSHPNLIRSVRFTLACALSGAVTDALWRQVPVSLNASTDVVGYAIFSDFNFVRYFDAYYAIAFVFPALALVLYHLLAWRGPLRKPRETRTVLPVVVAEPDSPRQRLLSTHSPAAVALRYSSAAVRLLLPTAAVVLEVSSARSPESSVPTNAGWIAGIVYLGVVAGGSALVSRASGRRATVSPSELTAGGARARELVRTCAALSVVPLLYVVSRSTSVTVSSDHRVVHYPWFPAWLVIVASVAMATWFVRRVLRSRAGGDPGPTENGVLAFVVGPVLLFLIVSGIPGASGHFAGFDDAQGLAAAQLAFHGFFPWKHLLFIHGVLPDIFEPEIGMAVFSNSRWGALAGSSIFVLPATVVVLYYFGAYFARRNRLLVLGFSLAMVLGLLSGLALRFVFAPLLLILFDTMLRGRSRSWCAAFMVVLVVESILTPEIGLLAIGLLLTLVAFEGLSRGPGTPLASAFFRTRWCFVFGVGLTAVWVVFLAAAGSLSGFIDYYRIFGPGHALSGAIPTHWSLLHHPGVTIEFFLPVVLIVLTTWRVVAKLRGRRTWTTREWTMVAAASWVALYWGKALGRADAQHVAEAFTVTIPLLLLWVIEVLAVGDRFVSGLRTRIRGSRIAAPRRLCTAAALVAVAAVAPQPILTLRQTADRFRTVVPTEPSVARLGYSLPGAIDTGKLQDLKTVLDRYAGASGPVFDFTNDPGFIYYLLGRVPASRFYHVSMAIPTFAQSQLVSDLERSRPRIVVFNDLGNGLPEWDGVLNTVRHYDVSQYLLDRYVPLVDADGTLFMIRSDLARQASPPPQLVGPRLASHLYFDAPTCAWGDIPNFLKVPGEPVPRSAVRIPAHVVHPVSLGGGRGGVGSPHTAPSRIESLVVPPRTDLASYRWLELTSPGPLSSGTVTVTDALGDRSHEITFNILPTVGTHVAVQVGSCLQWHGYQSHNLFLVQRGTGPTPAVWLAR